MAQASQASTSTATGRSAEPFELKSASLSLLALVLRSADRAELESQLQHKLGPTPDAFHHDPLLIDLGSLPPASGDDGQLSLDGGARIDLAWLLPLLRAHRLQPVGVVGANEAELAQALSLGLAEAPDLGLPARSAEPRTVVQEVVKEVVREVVVEREVPVAAEAPRTVVVDKPLRSGQQVYAKGADLVVLALVSHGAEVIADGHIHVYAPLRGKAIAGARGNTEARIFAASLEAELIAIAGIYRTTENPLPEHVLGKAAQVRLDGEKLVMEALNP
ncbi:septum site-determining protein MinC [Pelomonas sp. CA6]|uniref:septum site-determining protein MinC n=1 Tax=Pelomonas sp. CA6 TaxID=2907999 RepID=UPI001F4A3319|nr:septum site-determining protein MinC [Pelomonas sp. CA6]MCH7342362.1 septum site-determining protein MinC [Pelomonas sp. CA6]